MELERHGAPSPPKKPNVAPIRRPGALPSRPFFFFSTSEFFFSSQGKALVHSTHPQNPTWSFGLEHLPFQASVFFSFHPPHLESSESKVLTLLTHRVVLVGCAIVGFQPLSSPRSYFSGRNQPLEKDCLLKTRNQVVVHKRSTNVTLRSTHRQRYCPLQRLLLD